MDGLLRQVSTNDALIREGIAMATDALSDARTEGEDDMTASMLGYLVDAHRVLGELDAAEGYARETISLGDRVSDVKMVAAWIRLGEVLRCRDRFDEAIAAHEHALAMLDAAMERYRGFALQHLGKAFLNMGDFARAEAILAEALEIRLQDGDAGLIASTREALDFARGRRGALLD